MRLRASLAVCAVVLAGCQATAASDSSQPVTPSPDGPQPTSPAAVVSATVMPSPPASPPATATPARVVSAAYPPGSLARVAVETLLLREEPGTNAKAVARIPSGD